MKRSLQVAALLMGLACTATGTLAASRPFPYFTAYAAGVIRPNHLTRSQMNEVVREHYAVWKKAYLRSDRNGTYVLYDGSDSTVSEAHGYGMVIAAYMADQALFDSMFRYFKAHPSSIGPNLMAWKQELRNAVMVDVEGRDSATDGDLDIAYALQLADIQWGSRGEINYRAEAIKVMQDILKYDVNQTTMTFKPGDWAIDRHARHTRSSDFMTGHVLAFAKLDTANAEKWQAIHSSIVRIVNHQHQSTSTKTGLMQDFLVKSGDKFVPVTGTYLESKHDGDFHYNACRTPWRLPMSFLNYGRQGMVDIFRTQAKWIRTKTEGNPSRIKAGYYVTNGAEGKAYAQYSDLPFTAPFLISAMASGSASQAWVNKLWTSITGKDFGRKTEYYGDSIRLQVLLVASGNWWAP